MLVPYARRAIFDAWIVFLMVWSAAALTSKPRDKNTGSSVRLPLGLIILAVILVSNGRIENTWLARPLLPNPPWLILTGAALTFSGMALAFWARFHLARNWGPPATMRVGHELVTSGPYAYIRHPIYVGMSVALAGTAMAIGNVLAVVVAVLVIVRFLWAARRENALLVRQFGEQAERR